MDTTQTAPTTVGATVTLRQPRRRAVRVQVTVLSDLGGGTWLVGGYVLSRKYPGDFLGHTSRMVTADQVGPA